MKKENIKNEKEIVDNNKLGDGISKVYHTKVVFEQMTICKPEIIEGDFQIYQNQISKFSSSRWLNQFVKHIYISNIKILVNKS